jgi:hypothetical protein
MSATRPNPLRHVAETVLDERFGALDPRLRQDLATSLVRQWVTSGGHAGLVTRSHHFWFRIVRTDGGGYEVGFDAQPPRFLEVLRRAGVAEESIPGLLHQLNLCQSVRCRTQDGRFLRLGMNARERALRAEPAADEGN